MLATLRHANSPNALASESWVTNAVGLPASLQARPSSLASAGRWGTLWDIGTYEYDVSGHIKAIGTGAGSAASDTPVAEGACRLASRLLRPRLIMGIRVLRQQVQRLVGRKLGRFVAGEGTGTVVSFEFAPTRSEPTRIGPVGIRTETIGVQMPYCLLVLSAWRLDAAAAVLCGSLDDNSTDGPMLSGLRTLLEHEVLAVDLTEPGLDLTLHFSEGLTLRIFCDQVNEVDEESNYHLYFPGGVVSAGTRSLVRVS